MRFGARMAKPRRNRRVGFGLTEHVADVHERFPIGVGKTQERKRLIHAHVETRVRASASSASGSPLQKAVLTRYFAYTRVAVCGIVASIDVCRS